MASDFQELFQVDESSDSEEPEYPVVSWRDMDVRLLNRHHSLWGERLAECGKICAKIIMDEEYDVHVKDKCILELGAGSGLPSMCAARKGAKNVVCTDYPDEPLIDNIRHNMDKYSNAKVIGFKWGDDPTAVLNMNSGEKYDIIILSDVIFNDNQHRQLLRSIGDLMKPDGYALVLHTHHRTNKVKNDLQFFDFAEHEFHYKIVSVDKVKHPVMFVNDTSNTPEELELRTTAHIHKLYFSSH